MKNLKEKAAKLPEKTGCYLFKNKNGKIIYIGKAKNLRKRVHSYFSQKTEKDVTITENATDIEYYITTTEVEALILENNLIKKHKPKFNINLKDDKSYPYIELTINDEYPGIYFSRKPTKKNSLYFGPYPSAGAVKRLISLIEKYFMLKTCKKDFKNINRACLKFQINRCSAPCVNKITKENYLASAKMAQMFLEGKYNAIETELKSEMENLSENLEFEKAAEIRDILFEIKKFKSSQLVQLKENEDFEAIAYHSKEKVAAVTIFHFKNGRLIDKSQFQLENFNGVFQTFLERYFYNLKFPSKKYFLNIQPDNIKLLEEYLSNRFSTNITVKVAKKGKYFHILKTAEINCLEYIEKQHSYDKALLIMQKKLKLTNYPNTIICIDISHIAGSHTVGSLVSFKGGKPDKKNYRKFKIKETKGVNDYKSIEEVVIRYFEKLKTQNQPLPDLVVIDGGKGQLQAASKIFNKMKLPCDLISLAKKEETVFSHNLQEGYILDTSDLFSRILIKIRDEAHRFAITYNKNLRKKANLSSKLTEIKGIGKVKAEKLLKKFKSYENVLNASDKELKEILNKNDIKNLKLRQNGTFLTEK